MKHAKLSVGAIVAASALLMSACVTSHSSARPAASVGASAAKVTGPLEVVSYEPVGSPMYQRYQSLATEFEKQNPGTHITLTFGGGSGEPPIAARYQAGNPPDVNPSIAGPDGIYAKSGKLLDLTAALQGALPSYGTSWQSAMYPGVVPYLKNTTDGKVYAAPESVTTIQFFYNKAMFDKYGLTAPKTLDDLYAACDKLKANGVAPFAVTGTFNFYMELYYDYLLLRYAGADAVEKAIGGPTVNAADRTSFDSVPGVHEAATALQKMVTSGYFMKGFQSTDFTAAQLAFFQGKSAMILMGSWLQSEMSGKIPAGFQLGTFSFPTIAGASGDQTGTFGNVQTYEVASQAKNPQAAVAWLKFLASKDNQTSYVQDEGAISAYKTVPAPPGFEDTAASLSTGTIIPTYYNLFSEPTKIQNAYQLPIAKLFFGKENPDALVSDITSGLKKANS
jgi:raffinose/stachyose/melibiose transport system substrate-binding protein